VARKALKPELLKNRGSEAGCEIGIQKQFRK
jgi:hypothetical protein